jgi:predicted metal-dependent peptidase
VGALLRFLRTEPVRGISMATDGRRVFYDPEWLAGAPERVVDGVVIHEVLHLALGHKWPRVEGEVDDNFWNLAADLAVNWIIFDLMGFNPDEVPKDQPLAYMECYHGKRAEQIYEELLEDYEIVKRERPEVARVIENVFARHLREGEELHRAVSRRRRGGIRLYRKWCRLVEKYSKLPLVAGGPPAREVLGNLLLSCHSTPAETVSAGAE